MDEDYRHVFTFNGIDHRYTMVWHDNEHHMKTDLLNNNDDIFIAIINHTLNINTKTLDIHELIMAWVTSIVGYTPVHGVWPVTNTKEDCIKICTELDRVIELSIEDRLIYLHKMVGSELHKLILEQF